MDFVEGLPKSEGKTIVYVVVDRPSKFAHILPLVHPYTASMVAKVFYENIYKLYGLPRSVVSDRDAVFLLKFWQELFRLQALPIIPKQTENLKLLIEVWRCI